MPPLEPQSAWVLAPRVLPPPPGRPPRAWFLVRHHTRGLGQKKGHAWAARYSTQIQRRPRGGTEGAHRQRSDLGQTIMAHGGVALGVFWGQGRGVPLVGRAQEAQRKNGDSGSPESGPSAHAEGAANRAPAHATASLCGACDRGAWSGCSVCGTEGLGPPQPRPV
ncbi:MAG: hypothetical protein J3K34DRAFT_434221, partial [Monoraphidium minutum]